MLDQFIIFTKRGVVLFSHSWETLKGNPVDTLIKDVLLEERAGSNSTKDGAYELRWAIENRYDLIFVVVASSILGLTYLDALLESVQKDFVDRFSDVLKQPFPVVEYDARFMKVYDAVLNNAFGKSTSASQDSGSLLKARPTAPLSPTSAAEEEEEKSGEDKPGKARGPRRLTKAERKAAKKAATNKSAPKTKTPRRWGEMALSAAELAELDRSDGPRDSSSASRVEIISNMTLDGPKEADAAESTTSARFSTWFGRTTIGGMLQSATGNKELTEDDVNVVMEALKTQITSKNVAKDVADAVCDSVKASLVGRRMARLTTVHQTVLSSLQESIQNVLTPGHSVDILADVRRTREEGKLYSIAFIGVNGVGKSTSLAKVAYYLKSNGLRVMVAACDTFRAGAVEQLRVHTDALDITLYEQGYQRDAALVAQAAIREASERGFDVCLIDTAGRMQNNAPLMQALAKLVSLNRPDRVLFVGEALVGNDGIDQISEFDKALVDYSQSATPRRIDGIVLTKFDTIDDKVGATLSMVHRTGQPIVFVGVGQKYADLTRLNVDAVVGALLS